jgi:hypothetical protein
VPINVAGPAGQLIVEPASLTFAPGGLIGAVDDLIGGIITGDAIDNIAFFRAYFVAPGETRRVDVTARVGVSFSNFFPSTVGPESFAYFNLIGEGIALTSNPLAPTPPFGGTATMTVTYISEGQVFTDNVEITLDNPSLVGVEFDSAPDGTLTLPASGVNAFPVDATALYSNGFKLPIDDLDGDQFSPFPDTFELVVATPATGLSVVDGFVANGALSTSGGGAGQTAVLNVIANGNSTVLGSLNVALIDATAVTEVALDVFPTDINPSAGYSVVVTYNDAAQTTEDVTGVWFEIDSFEGPGFAIPQTPLFPSVGRLLGVRRGAATIRIDDDNGLTGVDNELGFLGLPGSDTLESNNFVDVNVLSTVPLSILGGILVP